MSQTAKLRLSKGDQVIGELDITAIPPKQPKQHTMLNLMIITFFFSLAVFSIYIVIYLLTH